MNIIGIDAGSYKSGVVIIENGEIKKGMIVANSEVCQIVSTVQYSKYLFIVEDLKAYAVRLSQDLIETAKFIGKLDYILSEAGLNYKMVERVKIKKMVYDKYPSAPIEVSKLIQQRGKLTKTGEFRKPSMIYVCDRVVANAMRYFWELPSGQGKRNKLGLSSHAWQALALCSYEIFRTADQ